MTDALHIDIPHHCTYRVTTWDVKELEKGKGVSDIQGTAPGGEEDGRKIFILLLQ
jgi:hypothetical protein